MAVSRRKALGILGGGAVLAATAKGATDIAIKSGKPKSVAIIGGGISGLSVAYNLVCNGFNGADITVVEKSPTLGGNAATAQVVLGQDYTDAHTKDFVRFADMGVNDVNLLSYKKLKAAMKEIGYSTDEKLAAA